MRRKQYRLTSDQALTVECALISVIGMDIADALSASDPNVRLARCRRASEAVGVYSILIDQRGWTDEAHALVKHWREIIADMRIMATRIKGQTASGRDDSHV